MAFRPNRTLASAIFEAARKKRVPLRQRAYLRTCFMFADDDKLRELEVELTAELVTSGAIPPTAVVDECYTGDWGVPPILDWILEHWEEILKIIMTIIGLFGVTGVLMALWLLGLMLGLL